MREATKVFVDIQVQGESMRLVCLVLFGASLIGPMSIAEASDDHVDVGTLEAFQANAQYVRTQMRSGGRYEALSENEKRAVVENLQRMENILSTHGAADRMDARRQGELFTIQEYVNSVLTQNDGDRLVCRVVPRTGSKLKQRECRTASDLERMAAESRQSLDANRRALANIEFDEK